LPVPHKPHELGRPVQAGASSPEALPEANTESFLLSFVDPQCGHSVPCQLTERTSTSLSFPQFAQ
jgi:hypothetical protein